ncbi:MAG: DUF4249 domain-containing protein [Saprospiraceae bacterium]|nr:DUF4249 domain-containing protein [Saprospiraceae bacterium]
MKFKTIPVLYFLVGILFLANCVRETNFFESGDHENIIVVDGGFSDGPGPHFVRIIRPGDYDKQAFEPVSGAHLRLTDDLGNEFFFLEEKNQDGITQHYRLDNVQGVPGRIYSLEIVLPNGDTYRSGPEKMPERILLDSVSVKGDFFVSNNADGSLTSEPRAFVYAHTKTPDQVNGRYLRWEAEAVYIFNEIIKIYNPFDIQKQCYITNRLNDQGVSIADPGTLQPGTPIIENVGKRKIDYAFEHRICFSVYQHTISRNAYEYWQKIGQLVSPTGTIFDTPAAKMPGNVENITDPGNPALGYFEISAIDTARIFGKNGLLGDDFLLQDVTYCEYDFSTWPPVNHLECDNCLVLPSSTLDQPVWWQ